MDDLLQRVADRDASALGELYDQQARQLFGLIMRILRDRAESEDVLQEVFLRVWQKADTYDPVFGSPRAWLLRIARNRAIDRIRGRRSRGDGVTPVSAAERLQATDPPPDARAIDAQTNATLAHALVGLEAEQRILIEYAFLFGYTQTELAVKFQLPLGTVKTRIRRGMQTLRTRLQHVHEP